MNVETFLFLFGVLSAVCLRDAMRLVLASAALTPILIILAIPLGFGGGFFSIVSMAGALYFSMTGGMLIALALMTAAGLLAAKGDCVANAKTFARPEL